MRSLSEEQKTRLRDYLSERKTLVDSRLREHFSPMEGPAALISRAMTYSLFAGGKRLRPVLCMASASVVGGREEDVLPVACALECIHTYSLIHDDLPAMDDDDLRRGKPTSHKVFGEAIALLAGDGLLTEAFRLMSDISLLERRSVPVLLEVIRTIAEAAGSRGMVGGQVADVLCEGKVVDFPVVEYIHHHKTGALIRASVLAGALLGGGSRQQVDVLGRYGEKIGLAFQISDDILDIEGDKKAMGKATGSDDRKGKATYPALLGLAQAKDIQAKLVEEAVDLLEQFGDRAEPLRLIARYIIERKK
ncbi:MAG: polyprenyl synthetase family protein [Deltaproteobacteria bacterium]|nr:polyprenyl synthetase family protein [Deltaproteobacteria bacterium]